MKNMKNFLIIMPLLAVFLMVPTGAKAEISLKTHDTNSFDLKVGSINKIANFDKSLFSFEVADINNNPVIDSWKVRVYCQGGIAVSIVEGSDNDCGKAIALPNSSKGKFKALFSNHTDKPASFLIKLKAYDKDGNWLYSDSEAFVWR